MKQRSGEIIYVESKLGSMRMSNVLAFLLTRRMPAVNNIMVDMVETSDCSNNHICWRVVQKTVEILVCQGQSEEYEQIIKVSLRSPCSPLDFSDQLAKILVQNKGYFSRRKTELIMWPCAKHADKTFSPKISIFTPNPLSVSFKKAMRIKEKPGTPTEEQISMSRRKFPGTFLFTEPKTMECYAAILAIIERDGYEKPWTQFRAVALQRDLSRMAQSKNLSPAYYNTYLRKLKKLGVLEDAGYDSGAGWGAKKTIVHYLNYKLQEHAPLSRRRSKPTPPPTGDAGSPTGTCPQSSQLELQNLGGLGDKLKPLGAQILKALGAQGISFRRNDQGITEVDVSY